MAEQGSRLATFLRHKDNVFTQFDLPFAYKNIDSLINWMHNNEFDFFANSLRKYPYLETLYALYDWILMLILMSKYEILNHPFLLSDLRIIRNKMTDIFQTETAPRIFLHKLANLLVVLVGHNEVNSVENARDNILREYTHILSSDRRKTDLNNQV